MPEPGKYAMTNDQALLLSLAKGEEQAFKELYDHYKGRVFNLAMLYVGREDAIEITQQVFISLWDSRALLVNVHSLRDYILTTTRNNVFRYLKQVGRQSRLLLEAMSGQQVEVATPEQHFHEKKLLKVWNGIIHDLPAQQRQVYQMIELQGISLDDAAEQLQLSKSTVKKHLELARRQVRKEILQRWQ